MVVVGTSINAQTVRYHRMLSGDIVGSDGTRIHQTVGGNYTVSRPNIGPSSGNLLGIGGGGTPLPPPPQYTNAWVSGYNAQRKAYIITSTARNAQSAHSDFYIKPGLPGITLSGKPIPTDKPFRVGSLIGKKVVIKFSGPPPKVLTELKVK